MRRSDAVRELFALMRPPACCGPCWSCWLGRGRHRAGMADGVRQHARRAGRRARAAGPPAVRCRVTATDRRWSCSRIRAATAPRASIGELAELLARAPQRPRDVRGVHQARRRGGGLGEDRHFAIGAAGFPASRSSATTTAPRRSASASRRRARSCCTTAIGRLVYSGGITGARGKSGDNAGRTDAARAARTAAHPTRGHHRSSAAPLFVVVMKRRSRRHRETAMVPELRRRAPPYVGGVPSDTAGRAGRSPLPRASAGDLRADRPDVRLPDGGAVAGGASSSRWSWRRAPGPAPTARSTSTSGRRVVLGGLVSLFPAALALAPAGRRRSRATRLRPRRC